MKRHGVIQFFTLDLERQCLHDFASCLHSDVCEQQRGFQLLEHRLIDCLFPEQQVANPLGELGTGFPEPRCQATPETVLGDFDDAQLVRFGLTSRMFRRGDDFYITTDGPEGEAQTFRIQYTFGARPLQQYMVEFADGRVQVLPIAWDTQQRRWFHVYPDEQIAHDDVLHWTRGAQNWNYMCAECHSTNVEKNYDLKHGTYHTTYSEIDVSCESCHGPGSIHVRLAEATSLFWDRRLGYGLVPLKAMWRFYATLQEPKELVVIDAADHIFDGKTSEVGDAVVDLLEGFEL